MIFWTSVNEKELTTHKFRELIAAPGTGVEGAVGLS